MKLRTGFAGLLAGLSIAMGGVALAATADTLLVEGYDPENRILVFGASEIDETGFDCTVEGTGFTYTTDSFGSITALLRDGAAVSFKKDTSDHVYGQTEGVCDLTAVDVTGPNGQVNHGQVVSSFVQAVKEQLREAGVRGGMGCLVHVIAHSDYGKGDQQRGPTVLDETVVVSGEVDLSSHEVACNHKKSDTEEADDGPGNSNRGGNGNGHGKKSNR
jgi:hypothetical protein